MNYSAEIDFKFLDYKLSHSLSETLMGVCFFSAGETEYVFDVFWGSKVG